MMSDKYINVSVLKEEKSWALKDCKIGREKDGIKNIETPDGHQISLVDTIGIMGDIVKVVQITRKDRKIVTLNQKQIEEITDFAKEYFKKRRIENEIF